MGQSYNIGLNPPSIQWKFIEMMQKNNLSKGIYRQAARIANVIQKL